MSIEVKDISVVVQGAIDVLNTPLCLVSIRKHLPNAEIIVSTWEGSCVETLDCDVLVTSKDPGGFQDKKRSDFINNLLRQLVSTQNGLKKASRKYILKMRSDLIFDTADLLTHFDRFKEFNDEYRVVKSKIIAPTFFTKKYVTTDGGAVVQFVPFHLSDWLLFGLKEDIVDVYDVPLPSEPSNADYFYNNSYAADKIDVFKAAHQYAPEQYIMYHWVKKYFKDVTFDHYMDYSYKNRSFYERFVDNNFVILSPETLGFKCNKEPYRSWCADATLLPEHISLGLYNEETYKEDYNKFCKKGDVAPIKVSIIIPVYNCEKYIEKCLYSVTGQTLTDIEIICVDDGSSDNSLDVIKKIQEADRRITIVSNEKNRGQSYSRNKGIEIAKGDYIGFVDADDWVDSNYFEVLYESAIQHGADIAQCSYKMVYPDRVVPFFYDREMKLLDSSKRDFNRLLMIYNSGVVVNKVYKKSLLIKNNIRFIEGMYWEDNPFVMDASLKANNIIFAEGIYYYYLQREKSTVYSRSKKLHLDFCESARHILDRLHSNMERFPKKDYVEFIGLSFSHRLDVAIRDAKLDGCFTTDELIEFTKCIDGIRNDFRYKTTAQKLKIGKHVAKLDKHINNFITPVKRFVRWGLEPASILFYTIKIAFKVLINFRDLLR